MQEIQLPNGCLSKGIFQKLIFMHGVQLAEIVYIGRRDPAFVLFKAKTKLFDLALEIGIFDKTCIIDLPPMAP